MTTYYHVAGEQYQAGEPLLCWDRLTDLGVAITWKWDEAEVGFDGDVVCLFVDRAEADEFATEHGGTLLIVTVPDAIDALYDLPWGGYLQPEMTRVSEGYPAVRDGIPAEWIFLTD